MHFEKLRYKRFPATAKQPAKVQKVDRRYNCKLSLQVGTAETKYLVRSKRYKKSIADTTASRACKLERPRLSRTYMGAKNGNGKQYNKKTQQSATRHEINGIEDMPQTEGV